jgi:FecR protein
MNLFKTGIGCVLFCFFTFVHLSAAVDAAELRAARVTQIINDVKLLPGKAAARAAVVNESISAGTAVRTGGDSRTELTFSDLTITRLGANTVFSFNGEARQIDLGSGAVLVQVPRNGAEAKVRTAAVTAAITGGTALFESNKGLPTKLLMLEGIGRFYPNGHPEEAAIVHGGEMVMRTADGRITQPTKFNAALVYNTSKLITSFPTLPNADLIMAVIADQQAQLAEGPSSPGSTDTIDKTDQAVTASATSTTSGAKFGPPTAITSPNPYVITSGTVINTDPMITTNGITNF